MRLFITVLLIITMPCSAGEVGTPAEVVERFNAVLVTVMKTADELGLTGRYQRLEPAIRSSHDFQTIVRIVTGKHWRELDELQRKKLQESFTQLSIATYAYQFDSYAGQTFRMTAEKLLTKDRATVRVEMHKKQGEPVQFNYTLIRKENNWYIVNVTANGVSDLALKRAEYSRVLEKNGFEALIRKQQEKIDFYMGKKRPASLSRNYLRNNS